MGFIRRYILLFIGLTCVNWTFVLSERVKCPNINVPNLRVKLRSKGRLANFSCKKRFELVGVKFAVCVPSGNWSQQIPSCVGTTCRKPESVANLIVEELYKGGVLKFTCGAGLIRSGPETIMCDGNRWSGEPPKCTEGTTLHCDFEDSGLCGWSQDFDDDFDWTWHGGETPTAQTGPRFDHTTNTSEGHYLYMESSAPQAYGHKTRLLSPPYSPVSMINMCLEFFYHMYGPDGDGEVGDLDVYVKPLRVKNITLGSSQRIFNMSGNQNDRWMRADVQLPLMNDTFQIVFQATRLKSWSGDIAIDDVRLHSCLEETTTSASPTDTDDTDDEDNSQEPPLMKTTERTSIQTTEKRTTGSTATTRTTLLPTTVTTPPIIATSIRTSPSTTASTQPTTKIITVTTREPTSTITSTSTTTTTTPAPSTRLTTIITTLRATSPPSTTSTPTRTTTTKPTKTSATSTTASSESTRTSTTTATSNKPTTATVKLTRPTTVTESTTTTTIMVSTTTATNDITTPTTTTGTASTTSRATVVKTTVESTSNPPSRITSLVTTDTDESVPAGVITSVSDSINVKDWSTPEAQASSTLMPSTTNTDDIGGDTGSDNINTDVYDYDNETPATPSDNNHYDDNDENDRESTKIMSTTSDYVDYDSVSDDLGLTSTFNISEGHNSSQPSASDNKDSGNDSEGSKSTQSETGKSLSETDLSHGAVREKDVQPSSTTAEVLPLIIGVAASVVVAAVVIAVLAYLWARNQRRKQEKEQEDQMNIITEYVETNFST